MSIAPLNTSLPGLSASRNAQGTGGANTTFDSASTAAESANFASMLRDLQNKAKVTEGHVVNSASATKQEQELKEACKGFEGMFLGLMYKQMRATVPKNELFGESNGQKIFQDMYDQKLMDNIADGGGIGLADMLYKQLSPQVRAQAHAQEAQAQKN